MTREQIFSVILCITMFFLHARMWTMYILVTRKVRGGLNTLALESQMMAVATTLLKVQQSLLTEHR